MLSQGYTLSGMPYTMDDHRRDAVRYPACSLEHVWRQRGNRTGHCARCHHTFEGVSLFDRHQSVGDDGRTICRDPETQKIAGLMLRLVDGSWRGKAMPQYVISGHGNPAEGDDAH